LSPIARVVLVALSLACCGMQPCPAQEAGPAVGPAGPPAATVPVACQVDAPEGLDAPVLRLDCEGLGIRAAYTLEAHRGAHADVAALDAMATELRSQRDRVRGNLQALRIGCAHQLRRAGEQLGDCHHAIEEAADTPSRLVWAGVGAGGAAVAGLLVALLVVE